MPDPIDQTPNREQTRNAEAGQQPGDVRPVGEHQPVPSDTDQIAEHQPPESGPNPDEKAVECAHAEAINPDPVVRDKE
jgi:hypothetical protein